MVHIAPTHENTPHSEMNRGILGERVSEIQDKIGVTLEKMREQEMILLEKKRKIEEIAVMCEKSGNKEIVVFAEIIRKTGDINARHTGGWTLLMNTVTCNRIEITKPLLEHPDISVSGKSNNRETLLMWATSQPNIKTMKMILARPDTELNESNYSGETALVWAVNYSHIDNIKLILNDSRLNLREHNQGKKALEREKSEEIQSLIKAKMHEQGIEF